MSTSAIKVPDYGTPTFASLPEDTHGLRGFAAGVGIQSVLLTAAVVLTLVAAPDIIRPAYDRITLVPPPMELEAPEQHHAPPPVVKRIAPPPVAAAEPKVVAPPPVVLAKLKPLPAPTHVEAPRVSLPPTSAPKFDSPVNDKPAGPKISRSLQTNVFGGSSAPVTLPNRAAHEVQTGGFGDPNGVPANANSRGKTNIAAVGSFDLPPGTGQGNGTGGSRGLRGTVASAGFGNGTATEGGGGGRGTASQGRVQTTSFGSAAPVADAPRKRVEATTAAAATPVKVLDKPTPTYTDEARKLHIEGEVLVEVVFGASGQVHVVRVVRGLGHGLDEAAIRAAQGIRFTPAQSAGQSVDSRATLHIVFQLT